MAFLERPDIPKTILDIPGFNPWNFLLAVVLLAWLASKRREELKWDMPPKITFLLLFYFFAITVAVARMLSDISGITEFRLAAGQEAPTKSGLIIDYYVNCIKYTIPGLLLFIGCNSRSRLNWALAALAGMYLFLALQVIKWMPLGLLTDGVELSYRALRVLDREIGYHRVDLSMILGGGACAIFAARIFAKNQIQYFIIISVSAITALSQVLTGGRMGYVTTAIIGLIFAAFRWRKLFLLLPIMVVLITIYMPSVVDRFTQGFGGEFATEEAPPTVVAETLNEGDAGLYAMTSGRNFAWPFVLDKIAEAPLFGYGCLAMQNLGISTHLLLNYGELFPHPHNAYLELIFDTGLFGAIPVFILFALLTKFSFSLFRDSSSTIFIAVGGGGLAIILAQLIASLGAQSFYPREGTVALWCAIGLVLRVYIERAKAITMRPSNSAPIDDLMWGRKLAEKNTSMRFNKRSQ